MSLAMADIRERPGLRIEGFSDLTSRPGAPMSQAPISSLRRRLIEDMTVRGFGEKTQSDYIRHVKKFTLFLGRSPDQAQPEDLRRYQVHQRQQGVQPPTMNGAVAAVFLHEDLQPA